MTSGVFFRLWVDWKVDRAGLMTQLDRAIKIVVPSRQPWLR
jgi:hypothetical protein